MRTPEPEVVREAQRVTRAAWAEDQPGRSAGWDMRWFAVLLALGWLVGLVAEAVLLLTLVDWL